MYRRMMMAVSLLAVVAGAAPMAGDAAPEAGRAMSVEAAAAARPGFADAVDRYLKEQMRLQSIPGMTLAVARRGQPLYVQGYGVATLEHDVPARAGTVYQLGSIGKQFTAVAVMMLADQRRLALDDPLSKYLPEVPAAWSKVTLRLMLNHQSGIPQLTTPQRQLLDLVHDYSDDELIRLAAAQPLDFEPGTDVSYSDTGYVLLGFVINRVAGEFYGDLLRERVFAPLGMGRTRVISDADIVPDRASGYELTDGGALRNQAYVSPALNRTADGSLYSTVLDLMRWDQALYGSAVLPHAELARMWQVDAHSNGRRPLYHFGYGWQDDRLRGNRVVEYDGNWQGFQAVMSRYVDKELSVILLTNLSLCRTERMAHAVAGLVDPDLAPYPEEIVDARPKLTAEFRRTLEAVRESGVPASSFTPGGRERLSSALHTLSRDLRENGPIARFSLVDEGGGRGSGTGRGPWNWRVYRAEEQNMVEFFTVTYARDGRIDDLELLSEY